MKQDIAPDLVLLGVPLPVQLSPADLLSGGDPVEAVHLSGSAQSTLFPFLDSVLALHRSQQQRCLHEM